MATRWRRAKYLGAPLAPLLALAGCGADATETDGRLEVVTTVAPLTSIVANVGGDRVEIAGIVPEGTDSHTFEPRPSVAERLATADVLFVNGLGLEKPVVELAEQVMGDGGDIVELGAETIGPDEYIFDFSFPESGGRPNPHLWTDPALAEEYARVVRDVLSERDPDNAAYYRTNHAEFAQRVDELDAAMREAFATIPPERRKLLTYHDAYAYFARDYGWEVVGAIQLSDFEDPTPGEVARLIDQVKAESVPAIFGSEVFPSPVLEQISREAGVEYVDDLRDDDLPGEPGADDHSWLGLIRFNYLTITEALGGDAAALDRLDVSDVAPDRAEYPQ